MTISIYDQLVPVLTGMLSNLDAILSKAEADAEARNIDPQVFLDGRIAPDMLNLIKQVQIMTDMAKGGASRLTGNEVPSWPDNEQTFADLHQRLAATQSHLASFKPEQFKNAETRSILLKFPSGELKFTGKDYFLKFVIPNFYFHYTTAYAILRHNGVQIGKRDFMGG